jgi:hypothetical protein
MKSLKTTGILTGLILTTFLITTAYANPCRSHFQKVGSALQKIGPPIVKLICDLTSKSEGERNQAQADKCNDDYEKAMKKIESLSKTYNAGAKSSKIGPRGLGFNATYSGNLKVERVFISPPVGYAETSITIKRTGGTHKKDWTIYLCGIDENGNASSHKSKVMNKDAKTFTHTFKNMEKNRVQVYLSKKGLKGVKYTLRVNPKGKVKYTAGTSVKKMVKPSLRKKRIK